MKKDKNQLISMLKAAYKAQIKELKENEFYHKKRDINLVKELEGKISKLG